MRFVMLLNIYCVCMYCQIFVILYRLFCTAFVFHESAMHDVNITRSKEMDYTQNFVSSAAKKEARLHRVS